MAETRGLLRILADVPGLPRRSAHCRASLLYPDAAELLLEEDQLALCPVLVVIHVCSDSGPGCVVAVLLFEGNMDSANKFDARAAATLAFEWTAWACQLGKHYLDMAGAISFMMFYCMLYFPA